MAESLVPGANVSAVARRHGVAQSLLYRWRKDAAIGGGTAPTFVPVAIAVSAPSQTMAPVAASIIDIVLVCGRVVRADIDVDTDKLAAIIAVLEAKA